MITNPCSNNDRKKFICSFVNTYPGRHSHFFLWINCNHCLGRGTLLHKGYYFLIELLLIKTACLEYNHKIIVRRVLNTIPIFYRLKRELLIIWEKSRKFRGQIRIVKCQENTIFDNYVWREKQSRRIFSHVEIKCQNDLGASHHNVGGAVSISKVSRVAYLPLPLNLIQTFRVESALLGRKWYVQTL